MSQTETKDATINISLFSDGGYESEETHRLSVTQWVAIQEIIHDGLKGRVRLAAPELHEALADMRAGWKYIRDHHGDLYGVGWDRAQAKADAALSRARGEA